MIIVLMPQMHQLARGVEGDSSGRGQSTGCLLHTVDTRKERRREVEDDLLTVRLETCGCPHQIRATVVSDTISNLSVSNASSAAEVSYTLAVSLSLYNPSLRTGIYYDTVDADRAPLPRRRRPRKFGTSSGFSSCGGSRGCGAR